MRLWYVPIDERVTVICRHRYRTGPFSTWIWLQKLLHGDMPEVHLLQLHAQRKVQKKSAAMGFSVSVWFNWDRGLKKPVFLRSQWWGGRKQVAIQIASWLPVMYVFRNAWLWRIAISPNEEWSTKLKHQQKVLNLAKSFSPSLQRKITMSLNIQLFSYLHSQEGESPDHLPSVLQVRVLFPLLIVKHTLQE